MTVRRGLLLSSLLCLAVVALSLWQRCGSDEGTGSAAPAVPPVAQAAKPKRLNPWATSDDVEKPALFYDRFETIGAADGLPSDKVTCVLAEGEHLIVGTDKGLARRRAGQWSVLGEAEGLAHRYVTSVARDSGSGALWVSTLNGLSRVTGSDVRTFTQNNSGLMNDVVYHVVAADGLVWAATAAGLSVFDTRRDTWALYDHENSIMHEPWCYAVALGPQRTWVGVWGGGIVELDSVTSLWREYRDPDGEMELDLLRDDGPIHDVTSFLAYAEGVLWQSTYFGLSRYDGRQWRSYLAKDSGLPGDFLNHIDARGQTVFLASDEGFGVFDGETCVSYRRSEDGRCDVRTWRGGKQVAQHVLPSAPADNYVLWVQGGPEEIWIATGRGLSHGVADTKSKGAASNDQRAPKKGKQER